MIREFLKGDETAIAELERECFSQPWSEDAVLSSYKEGIRFFLYEKEDNIIGYVGLQVTLDEGYITNIATHPSHRRCGVGKSLLTKLDSVAEGLKLSFVSLEVRRSNSAAIALYSGLGYKNEGVRKNFYSNPLEDAIIMTKRR